MRDSYTQEQLINALLTFAGPQVLYEDLPDEVRRVCKQAADMLQGGPNGDGWIDAHERLPANGMDVLIYHCLGDTRRGAHAYDVAYYFEKLGWGFPWDRGNLNPKPRWVVAWKPLPEAPDTTASATSTPVKE